MDVFPNLIRKAHKNDVQDDLMRDLKFYLNFMQPTLRETKKLQFYLFCTKLNYPTTRFLHIMRGFAHEYNERWGNNKKRLLTLTMSTLNTALF